jgi:hypothetical protein
MRESMTLQKSNKNTPVGKGRPAADPLKEIRAEAKRKGLDKPSMREINGEINAVRRKRPTKRSAG